MGSLKIEVHTPHAERIRAACWSRHGFACRLQARALELPDSTSQPSDASETGPRQPTTAAASWQPGAATTQPVQEAIEG